MIRDGDQEAQSKSGATSYYVYLKQDGSWRYVGKAAVKEDAKTIERRERERVFQVQAGLRVDAIDTPFSDLALSWADKRLETHRRGKDDRWRMRKHIEPFFAKLRVREIDVAAVRAFIDHGRRGGLGPTTIQHCVRLLGRFFNELVLKGKLPSNPVFCLDRATRRLFEPTRDPRKTPFIRKKEDIAALYRALAGDVQVMFAVGVFAGLRTGEILGLGSRPSISTTGTFRWSAATIRPPRTLNREPCRSMTPSYRFSSPGSGGLTVMTVLSCHRPGTAISSSRTA